MNTFATVAVCVLFIVIGVLLAIYAANLVNWLYDKTMSFWSRTAGPTRKRYTDERFRQSWYWKAWWLSSVWVYRIIGILVAVFFAVLLIVTATK